MKTVVLLITLGMFILPLEAKVSYSPIALGVQTGTDTVVVAVPIGGVRGGGEGVSYVPSSVYASKSFPNGMFAIQDEETAVKILKAIGNQDWSQTDNFNRVFTFNSGGNIDLSSLVQVKQGQKVYVSYPAALVAEGVVTDISFTTSRCQYQKSVYVSPELFLQVKIRLSGKRVPKLYDYIYNWPKENRFVLVTADRPARPVLDGASPLLNAVEISNNLNKNQLTFDIDSDGKLEMLKFFLEFRSELDSGGKPNGGVSEVQTIQLLDNGGKPFYELWCYTPGIGRFLDVSYLEWLRRNEKAVYSRE